MPRSLSSLRFHQRVRLGTLCAALVLASTAAGQGAPFPKGGLRRIPWNPSSTLTLGSAEAGAAAIALRFSHDAAFGARLDAIAHRGTRADGTVTRFEYSTTPPPGEPPALWKAVLRPVDAETPVVLYPPPASLCRVYADDPTTPRTVLFQWAGTELPDPLCDCRFWMELRADIDPDAPWRVTWQSRLGRLQRPGNARRYTLDEVEAPIVHVKAPGDGLLARLLVPIAGATTLPAANLPMRIWQVVGYDLAFEHPARDQQLQFSAMYSGDPASIPIGGELLSSYRKILYFGTEDTEGYYKQFKHRVLSDAPTLTYRWAPTYFPTYGPSPALNYHASAYPVVFEALEAKTDSFWFDCTERYRTFVERDMGLVRIADPAYPNNPDFPRATPFVANSVIQNVAEAPLPAIYPPYTAHALRLREVFDGADGRRLPTFMEWQKWLKGDPNDAPSPGRPPEDPIGPGYNPKPYSGAFEAVGEPPRYVLDEIEAAYQAGINASVYTSPLVVNRNDWPSFDADWLLRQRDGSLVPVGAAATGNIVDFGARPVPAWMAGVLYDDIMDTAPGLGGVFFDVISGGGSYLRYPEEPDYLFRMRRYHGGTAFVRGTQQTFDLVRRRIARDKPTAAHPDIPFIPAETVQEFLAGRYDFGQQGLKSFPNQMQLNTIFDALVGVPSFAPEATNPSPPLWNAVYHEWSRAEGLTVMLSVLGVNGPFFGGGQDNPAFLGLTWPQWGDYMRFVHALWWVHGSKPTSFQYYSGYEGLDLLVDAPGGGVTVRDPAIPQQGQLVGFLQRLHHSLDRFDEAGKFLSTGRLERPLQTPQAFSPLAVLQGPNPSTAVAANVDPASPGVLHFYENFFSTQPYPVPHVFHSVWRSVETGELGIMFVNWTDQPAWWRGTFDPRLYAGFEQGGFTVHGVAPTGAGVTEYAVGSGDGPTELAWPLGATSGITLRHHAAAPGLMPARSVQVFVVRPQ
jgi:hypothetical protein